MIRTRHLVALFGLACLAAAPPAGASQRAQPAAAQPSIPDATRYNASGLLKARNRDFDGAIADYSEAIRLDPAYADAFYNRGLARSGKGDVDEAIEDYSRTIAINPRHAPAYFRRGAAYARKRDFDRAIDSFSAGLEINPTSANAYDDRGLAKTNKGDIDGAIADLNTAVSLDPKSARAFNNRGFAKSKKSDIDGAIADYTEAIRLNGTYTLAYINRGLVRTRKDDLEGAIADFTQAITLEPNNAAAYLDRGRARQRRGETSAADLDFTRATTLDPKLTRPATPPPPIGVGTGVGSRPQVPASSDGPYRPGPGVTTPRVVHEVKPRYTVDAMAAKIQGSVLLECVVAADGTVSDARVVRTLDPGLDAEAVNAARQWRFEPGTKDGTPVPVRVIIELTFTLRGSPPTPAPLALPAEFVASQGSARPAADSEWQEQTIERAAFRTHVAVPKGWAATTGLPGAEISFQNLAEPFGVTILKGAPQAVAFAQPFSADALKSLADGVSRTMGLSAGTAGQTQVGDRLWLWIDSGPISSSDLARLPQVVGFARGLVSAARAWTFVTSIAGQFFGVTFYIVQPQGLSEEDFNRLPAKAGPVFARALERLSFDTR